MHDDFIVKNCEDFYNFFVQVCNFKSEKDGKYIRYYVNPEFGEGYIEQIKFRNGIELCITSLYLKKSIGFEYDLINSFCEINYMIDGNLFNIEGKAGVLQILYKVKLFSLLHINLRQ